MNKAERDEVPTIMMAIALVALLVSLEFFIRDEGMTVIDFIFTRWMGA